MMEDLNWETLQYALPIKRKEVHVEEVEQECLNIIMNQIAHLLIY